MINLMNHFMVLNAILIELCHQWELNDKVLAWPFYMSGKYQIYMENP